MTMALFVKSKLLLIQLIQAIPNGPPADSD